MFSGAALYPRSRLCSEDVAVVIMKATVADSGYSFFVASVGWGWGWGWDGGGDGDGIEMGIKSFVYLLQGKM